MKRQKWNFVILLAVSAIILGAQSNAGKLSTIFMGLASSGSIVWI